MTENEKKGTLKGDPITIDGGVATADPPCTLKTYDGKHDKSECEKVIITGYRPVEESQDIAKYTESDVILIEALHKTSADNPPARILATDVYPNPTDKSINVSFNLENTSNVHIVLHDMADKELYKLYNDIITAGKHYKTFSIETLPAGTYYIKFTSNNSTITKRFVV